MKGSEGGLRGVTVLYTRFWGPHHLCGARGEGTRG